MKKKTKILMYGFTSSIIENVMPMMRKKEYDITWVGNSTNNNAPVDIDSTQIENGKINRHLPDDCDYLYKKVYKNLVKFLNAQARKSAKYHDNNFFDMLDIFNQYFNFYSHLLLKKKFEAVVFSYSPHDGGPYVLYLIAKALNMPVIMFYPGTYNINKTNYFFSTDTIGDWKSLPCLSKTELPALKPTFKQIIQETPYQMNPFVTKWVWPRWLFNLKKKLKYRSPLIATFGSSFMYEKRSFKTLAENYCQYLRKKEYYYNEAKLMTTIEDKNEKFVYFPLHLQPELVTALFSYEYFDQILAIEKLSHFIPKDWKIYVKDHPHDQTEYQRGSGFYKRLKAIKNVRLINKKISGYLLMEQAQFVATISGTSGFEANCGGKNSLYFGQTIYRGFPGVFEWKNKPTLKELLEKKWIHQDYQKMYVEFSKRLGDGVLDQYYAQEVPNFNVQKNHENILFLIESLLNHVLKRAK